MSVPNIAFVGLAGAGKTTAAEVLGWFPNLGFQRISFAEPLKVMLDTQTDRHRLQEFGTDIVRRYETDAWVRLFWWHLALKHLVRGARGRESAEQIRWVNDDCRFENELAALRDAGWAIVEVQAPVQVRIDRLTRNGKLTDPAQLEHSSEKSLDSLVPDAVVINDRGEPELAAKIKVILEELSNR